jgi:hypothetical protein
MWDMTEEPKAYFTDAKGQRWQVPVEHTLQGRFRQWVESENPRPGKEWESSPEALRGLETSPETMEGF